MKKEIELKIPSLPNFIFDIRGAQYAIHELSEKELRGIGAEWTEALVVKAKQQEHAK